MTIRMLRAIYLFEASRCYKKKFTFLNLLIIKTLRQLYNYFIKFIHL